ncbi:MAG: helix-turn-helix domain-containing protein, partial [Nitrososphaerales archaeon]
MDLERVRRNEAVMGEQNRTDVGRPVVVLLTPEEAAEALRIGRTRMYRLIREGAVRSVKVCQSRRV